MIEDIEEIANNLDFKSNELKCIGHNLFLTNHEIEILDYYDINYKKCLSLKEIIREIEDRIEDMENDSEELELISQEISERDYYQNTNK